MYFVYLLSNSHHTVYYVGMTNDLGRRIEEHKLKVVQGFTKRYNIHKLLYFEELHDADEAFHRERQLKRYKREWKDNLIRSQNPNLRDLAEDFGF